MINALLAEYDQEMAGARKTLERVPADKFEWAPHVKSMPMGRLATHLAMLPGWIVQTINQESLDLAPPGEEPFKIEVPDSTGALVQLFDQNASAGRETLAGTNPEHLLKPWSLMAGGNILFTLPRAAVIRSFVMNHIIHHRAQLGVYLRMNDLPVPSLYGPSADEANF